jgi:Rod binding domain-containing protein
VDKIKPLDTGPLTPHRPTAGIKPSLNNPEEAAVQFEALILQEMMKSMWQTVQNGGLLSGSREEETYRDMLNEAVAQSIASGKGVGIKDVIAKDINKLEKK